MKESAKGTQEAGHEEVVELIGRLKGRRAEHLKDWLEERSNCGWCVHELDKEGHVFI